MDSVRYKMFSYYRIRVDCKIDIVKMPGKSNASILKKFACKVTV
jgi:hypothetical protein